MTARQELNKIRHDFQKILADLQKVADTYPEDISAAIAKSPGKPTTDYAGFYIHVLTDRLGPEFDKYVGKTIDLLYKRKRANHDNRSVSREVRIHNDKGRPDTSIGVPVESVQGAPKPKVRRSRTGRSDAGSGHGNISPPAVRGGIETDKDKWTVSGDDKTPANRRRSRNK